MAAGLPDDLVLEYDMLQLVDGDESASFLDPHYPAAPVSPTASLAVDELMAGCSVGVGIATQTNATDAPATTVSKPADAQHESTSASLGDEVPAGDELDAFLLDGEKFLRDMEQVVKLNLDEDTHTEGEHATTVSAPKPPANCDGAMDLDSFTDIDMMSSPCPSCPSTLNGSPCKTDCDEFDSDCPLLVEQKKQEELQQQQQQQQQKQQDWLTAHVPAPMSPPTLPHTPSMVSTPSTMSQQSPLSHSTSGEVPSPCGSAATEHGDEAGSPRQVVHTQVETEDVEEPMDESLDDEMELLEKEAKYLDAQKDYLVSRAKSSRPQRTSIKAKRRGRDATTQPKLLLKSEQDNKLLNDLVSQQKVYTDNFKAMLAFAPVNDVRLALMTPMESYIRLGKDFNERRQSILALREEKLDATYKYIEQKAQGLDFEKPYQYSDMFEKFGKHYCVNFAISKYDGVSVFQVGRAIYEQIAGKDETLNKSMGGKTIRESYDTVKCNFMHQRIVSSMHWEGDESEKMPDMESNAIFYCRFGDNSAVMATDYIDQDDLHPYDSTNRIRKDVSSGVVLTGHENADGSKYVVMKRFLMAKYHMYPHKVTKEQQERFFANMPKCHDSMKSLVVDRLERSEGECTSCSGGN